MQYIVRRFVGRMLAELRGRFVILLTFVCEHNTITPIEELEKALKGQGKLLAVGVVVVVALVIVGFTVPVVAVPYEVTTDYQVTETYYENEPYQVEETYTERIPYEKLETYIESVPYQATETYTEEAPATFEIISNLSLTLDRALNPLLTYGAGEPVYYYYPLVKMSVKNSEEVTAEITIKVTLYYISNYNYYLLTKQMTPDPTVLDGLLSPNSIGYALGLVKSDEKPMTVYALPNEAKFFEFQYKGIDNDSYYFRAGKEPIISSIKMIEKQRVVTKYRSIEKIRPVTMYKEEEKTRPVTLYRDVKKTRPVTIQKTVTEYKKKPLILSWFD